jgi:transposase
LRFRALLRCRNPLLLQAWLDTARDCSFPFTERFARLLEADRPAVELSIAAPWSNGPVEGHINRLKVIKRQMYGRAGF